MIRLYLTRQAVAGSSGARFRAARHKICGLHQKFMSRCTMLRVNCSDMNNPWWSMAKTFCVAIYVDEPQSSFYATYKTHKIIITQCPCFLHVFLFLFVCFFFVYLFFYCFICLFVCLFVFFLWILCVFVCFVLVA